MKVAIVGSRSLTVENLGDYLPKDTTEIISGGAVGVDSSAKDFALKNNIKYTEILPQYNKFGKSAPLKRNIEIIKRADFILIFWDGKSKGTEFVIKTCEKNEKTFRVLYR